jgi:CMP-N-acetylneuraminic acid synthetase
MPEAYEHNGALYLSSIEFLKKVKSYNIPEARAYEMVGAANVDIDDPVDLQYAEFLLKSGGLQ